MKTCLQIDVGDKRSLALLDTGYAVDANPTSYSHSTTMEEAPSSQTEMKFQTMLTLSVLFLMPCQKN